MKTASPEFPTVIKRFVLRFLFGTGAIRFSKERIFGLTGSEGNHGEDVKEYYFYLDSTPTHSYMKFLYKYPQSEFPYSRLIEENRKRSKQEGEFELMDTGVFDEDKYFDCFVEYAKAGVEDILIKVTIANRGAEDAEINVLPTVWFRNTWSWNGEGKRPNLFAISENTIELETEEYGKRFLFCENADDLLFTENNTNKQKLYSAENESEFVKDGINDYIVNGNTSAVNPAKQGTKVAANYFLNIPANSETVLRLRLTEKSPKSKVQSPKSIFADFDKIFKGQKRSGRVLFEHHSE